MDLLRLIICLLAVCQKGEALSPIKTSTTRLFASDPTQLFNADILRIASRTSTKQSSFNPIHAADHSNRMLNQMLDMYESSNCKTAKPNSETFRIVLKAFSNLGGQQWEDINTTQDSESSRKSKVNAVDRIENIMIRWNEFQHEHGEDPSLQLNTALLNQILKAYARCGHQKIPHTSFQSDTIIEGCLPWLEPRRNRGSCAERAEKLLMYMIDKQDELPSLRPNAQSYAFVIEAWSRQQPSAKMFKSKLKVKNAKYNNVCASRATYFLHDMELLSEKDIVHDESETGNDRRNARRILLWAYSDVLDAWARSDAFGASEEANELIHKIEDVSRDDVDDLKSIQDALNLTEKDKDEDDTEGHNRNLGYTQLNMEIFDSKDSYLDSSSALYPSDQSYTSAILAISRGRNTAAAQRCHQLLNNMLELYDSGKWIKNRPSLLCFNAVISAYANSPESGSADKAEKMLNRLLDLYFDEDRPHYNYLRPDTITFNSVVSAWAKSTEEAAVYNAEEIVKKMEKFSNANGSKFLPVEPDKFTYTSLLQAWIRSGLGATSADNAEIILKTMLDKYYSGNKRFLPNQKAFTQVINAWGKCSADGNDFAVKRAIAILDEMESLYNDGCSDLKPDIITYSSIIDTIAKSRLPNGSDLALNIINKIERQYQEGDLALSPNARTYSGAFLAVLHSEERQKHIKAKSLLERMEKLGVEANSFSYNYAINCAASIKETESDSVKTEAFKVALNAFTKLRKSSYDTDSFTFNFFLKACRLLPASRTRSKIVQEAFTECLHEGKLTKEVTSRLDRVLEPAEVRELIRLSKTIG